MRYLVFALLGYAVLLFFFSSVGLGTDVHAGKISGSRVFSGLCMHFLALDFAVAYSAMQKPWWIPSSRALKISS